MADTRNTLYAAQLRKAWNQNSCRNNYGEFHADEKRGLFLGRSLVEGYKVEQQQNWCGGVLSKNAYERVQHLELYGQQLPKYPVPNKGGKDSELLSELALDWTVGSHPPSDLRWSDDSPEPSAKDWTEKYSICQKWYNTWLFHRKMCRFCFSGIGGLT